ncbi:MAG TPA: carboxypeptidase-like regulatory domain-containing protein [Candidatus Acidoferrales bacterium]|nr:carboxypeptidase-like regulatory domain-containing protein [Candidatus Acidoferrales bacterium]
MSSFGEQLTRRPHIFAIFILVLPVFSCFPLLAQTTALSLPDDPIARSGSPQVQGVLAQENPSAQLTEPERPLAPLQNERSTSRTPRSQSATILGTVTDTNDNPVAGATVGLHGAEPSDVPTVMTNDAGVFEIHDVEPGILYQVTISVTGFANWESPVIVLKPGQRKVLDVNKLRIEEVNTAVTVTPESSDEMAVQQVKIEEKQRGFGIIPNFFAVYDPNPAPLNAKLKFNLAFRAIRDPFTAVGVAVIAGAGQVAGHPAYVQGAKGYGERFGAIYANQFTTIMIGGAVLPSLLHQDPRYFYQGSGTKKSRALHALSSLLIARGDNGRTEPNFSSLGGDLASAAISNMYYPEPNRDARVVLENFAVNTAVHAGVRLLQEFVFRPTKGTVVSQEGAQIK